MSFCRYCGNKIEEGDLFCNKCGAKVVEDNSNSGQSDFANTSTPGQPAAYSSAEVKKSKGGAVVGIIIILVLVLAIIGAVLFLLKPFKKRGGIDLYSLCNKTEGEVAAEFGVPINEYKMYPSDSGPYAAFTTDGDLSIMLNTHKPNYEEYSFYGSHIGDPKDQFETNIKNGFMHIE